MRWSLKIASVSGIGIFVHITFLLLLAFLSLVFLYREQDLLGSAAGLFLVVMLFGCVLLHELGHAFAARHFGIGTKDITLLPIGGVSRLERMPEEPAQEILVALAGPAVNWVIAGVLLLAAGPQAIREGGSLGADTIGHLFWANVILGAFNLVPAFPMDGGRILRALLALRYPYVKATRLAASVGQTTAVLFGLCGLFWNPFLLLIAVFVYVGAAEEASSVTLRSQFRDLSVRDAMLTRYRTLSVDSPLSEAAYMLVSGSQQDFPVVDGDRPVGILTRAVLLDALEKEGPDVRVGQVMNPGVGPVERDEMLEKAFQKMKTAGFPALPVTSAGRLVGLLTLETVGRLVLVRSALRASRHVPAGA